MDETIFDQMMLQVCIMNYLEACQRLLGLSSSSERFHISITLAQREEQFKTQVDFFFKCRSTGFMVSTSYPNNLVTKFHDIDICGISVCKKNVYYLMSVADKI